MASTDPAQGLYSESQVKCTSLTQPQGPASAHSATYDHDPHEDDDSSEMSSGTDRDVLDTAHRHMSNEKLRERDAVKQLFQKIPEHKTLHDIATGTWLGFLPNDMMWEAVPLFTLESESVYEEYQLHLSHSCLRVDVPVKDPHWHIGLLSIDEHAVEEAKDSNNTDILGIVLGLGRLFVRAGRRRRTLSKWTGYEVFVDAKLQLWMVFDKSSTNSRDTTIYPVKCLLGDPFRQEAPEYADIARLCSLHDITEVRPDSLEKVKASVENTKIRTAKLKVNQLDIEEEIPKAPSRHKSSSDETVRTTMSEATGTSHETDATEISDITSPRKKRRLDSEQHPCGR